MRACLVVLCLAVRCASADEWDDALRGGLVGAALGAIVGHNSDMRDEFAIPAFAAAGALIGYGSGDGWWGNDHHHDGYAYGDDGYWADDGWRDGWGRYHSGPRYYRYDDVYGPRYDGHHRYSKAPKPHKPSPSELAPRHDLTPGVELVDVPITLPGGTVYNVRFIKLSNLYIGPQGETYAELPTTDMLAQRYLPKKQAATDAATPSARVTSP